MKFKFFAKKLIIFLAFSFRAGESVLEHLTVRTRAHNIKTPNCPVYRQDREINCAFFWFSTQQQTGYAGHAVASAHNSVCASTHARGGMSGEM